jgi:hypothetical protein
VIEGEPPSERYSEPDEGARAASSPRAEYGTEAPLDATSVFAAQQPTHASFPWPPAEGATVAGAFMRTWQGATFQPKSFFAALPDRGSLGSALLYYLPLGIIGEGVSLFWTMVRSLGAEQENTVAAGEIAIPPLVTFLLSPVFLIVLIFLAAGVTHGLLTLFGGANRDFHTTTRVFAFAYSPRIFSVVPVVGDALGFLWMVVIAIIGLRAAQRAATGRAAAAVIIPVLFLAVLWLVLKIFGMADRMLQTPV